MVGNRGFVQSFVFSAVAPMTMGPLGHVSMCLKIRYSCGCLRSVLDGGIALNSIFKKNGDQWSNP